jgi:hypothetical protein
MANSKTVKPVTDKEEVGDTVALFSSRNLHWTEVGSLAIGYNIVSLENSKRWMQHTSVRLATPEEVAKAYGKSASDYFYDWSEKEVDHGNSIETVSAAMTGAAKIRFKIDGADTDFGVAVVDSYSPDPASAAGRTLLGS